MTTTRVPQTPIVSTLPTDCPNCGDPWSAGKTFCNNCGYNLQTVAAMEQMRQENEQELQRLRNLIATPAQHLNGLVTPQNGVNSNLEVFRKWLIGPLCLILGYITMNLLNSDIVVTSMIWGINTAAFIGGVLVFVLTAILFFVTLYRD